MNNVLITGATGFIGRNLICRLKKEGFLVSAIVRPTSDTSTLPKNINMLIHTANSRSLPIFIKSVKPDVVIHLATLFTATHKTEQITDLINSNITFGTELLDTCAKIGTKNFINVGTHFQNYNREAYNPVSLYAATKQGFEDIIKYYTQVYKMKSLTVKIYDTYGPFDTRRKILTLFKENLASGNLLNMSPGEQKLGLTYIDDVVEGFVKAIKAIQTFKDSEQKCYLVKPKQILTLKQVATTFEDVCGKALNIKWGATPYREREIMEVWDNAPNLLEGIDTLSLNEGLKKMLKAEGII